MDGKQLITNLFDQPIKSKEPEITKTSADLKPDMIAMLNAQMNREEYASHMYHAIGAVFGQKNLEGIEKWFYKNSLEEGTHSMRFNDYIIARNGIPVVEATKKPEFEYNGPIGVFEQVLKLEMEVTGYIRMLFAFARGQADYQTEQFLQWFLEEQTKSEKEVAAIIDQFKAFGETGAGLAIMDERLGEDD